LLCGAAMVKLLESWLGRRRFNFSPTQYHIMQDSGKTRIRELMYQEKAQKKNKNLIES